MKNEDWHCTRFCQKNSDGALQGHVIGCFQALVVTEGGLNESNALGVTNQRFINNEINL